MTATETIDALGLLCPLPVLKLRKRMVRLAPGECILLLADDPAAVVDVPHFCSEAGHDLLSIEEHDTHQAYLVRKSATA